MRQPTKKATFRPEAPAAVLPRTHLPVPGDRGQGLEMPVLEQRRHETGAGGAQEIVHRFDEETLEFGPPGQEAVEGPRLGQEMPEDRLFQRREAQVARQDGPALDEDVQDLDAAGAVGGAGAAEQAAAEMVLDPAGVLQNFLQQAVQQGELAPGHVRLPAGFGEQRADRLAEAAAHADHQLVFQIFH